MASLGIDPSTTSTNGSSSPRSALCHHSMKLSAPCSGPHSKSISGQCTAIFGSPGSAPSTISSMLGWVAAVRATESPSQLSPPFIQRMWTTPSSAPPFVGVSFSATAVTRTPPRFEGRRDGPPLPSCTLTPDGSRKEPLGAGRLWRQSGSRGLADRTRGGCVSGAASSGVRAGPGGLRRPRERARRRGSGRSGRRGRDGFRWWSWLQGRRKEPAADRASSLSLARGRRHRIA